MTRIPVIASGVSESIPGSRDQVDDGRCELTAGVRKMADRLAETFLEIALRPGNFVEALLGRFVREPGVSSRVRADRESRAEEIANHRPRQRSWNGRPLDANLGVQQIHHQAGLRLRDRWQQQRGKLVGIGARRVQPLESPTAKSPLRREGPTDRATAPATGGTPAPAGNTSGRESASRNDRSVR